MKKISAVLFSFIKQEMFLIFNVENHDVKSRNIKLILKLYRNSLPGMCILLQYLQDGLHGKDVKNKKK